MQDFIQHLPLLATGSFSRVYLFNNTSALKSWYHLHNNGWLPELAILSSIHHPHIIDLINFFPHPLHILMPLATSTLDHHRGRLSAPTLQHIFQQVLSAIHYLHTHHIWHGDIKPNNILLDNIFSPKLSDFNLSRYASRGTISPGCYMYAAPEVLLHLHTCDHRLDLWSLAITMCETYTPGSYLDLSKPTHSYNTRSTTRICETLRFKQYWIQSAANLLGPHPWTLEYVPQVQYLSSPLLPSLLHSLPLLVANCVARMLRYQPDRVTTSELLQDPYFSSMVIDNILSPLIISNDRIGSSSLSLIAKLDNYGWRVKFYALTLYDQLCQQIAGSKSELLQEACIYIALSLVEPENLEGNKQLYDQVLEVINILKGRILLVTYEEIIYQKYGYGIKYEQLVSVKWQSIRR